MLNIRHSTASDLCPNFLTSFMDFLETLVEDTQASSRAVTCRGAAKCAGAMVCLRERGLCTALLIIPLSNVRSLCVMDEIHLLTRINKHFSLSSVIIE